MDGEPGTAKIGVGPWEGPWPDDARLDPHLLRDGDRRNVVDGYRYWRQEAIVADLDGRRHPFHVAVENWVHDANIGSVIRTANAFNAAAFHIVGRRRWNRRGAMVTDRYQHEYHHADVADLVAWAGTAGGGRDTSVGRGIPLERDASLGRDAPPGRGAPLGRGALRGRDAPPGRDAPLGRGAPSGRGIPLIGIDNVPGAVALETYDLPRECVLVFGQEGPGISAAMLDACDVVLAIGQYGSTRSINAGAAAAVAMHAWVRRHVFGQPPR
ncbi:tRNA/rRNA methyltransferase (SpoU) [Nostocoides japonicum T1-X7]|uniref:tRNA/rRNA methyltransferase (SpoU) n=1 Tax=Nostocoides japonicum T1-X7 TaxID=1194083 RepID=A0A077M0C8_9MICO|nr:tRNA/rRNA methyltransferase (SpoU) [Tetrasphaera japonica T1-X7]